MIKKLTINNFAIIDNIAVDFGKKFNVITGETGAGKSLIVNAIDILIGGRLNEKMLRDKSKELSISGIFNLNNELINISRIYKDGKSYSYLNNQKVSKKYILEKFSSIIQFQKQHDSNSLLNVNKHLEILDSFTFDRNALLDIQKLYHNYLNDKDNYEKFLENVEANKNQYELYQYQLNELKSVNLNVEEEMKLSNQYKQHINSKKVIEVLNEYIQLNEDSNYSPLSKIDTLSIKIKDFKESDKEIEDISNRIDSIVFELKDIKDDIANIEKKYHFNLSELDLLENKVSQYEEIKRKYGGSIKAAEEYKTKIESSDYEGYNKHIYYSGLSSMGINKNKEKLAFSTYLYQENHQFIITDTMLEDEHNLNIQSFGIISGLRVKGNNNLILFKVMGKNNLFKFDGESNSYFSVNPKFKLSLNDTVNPAAAAAPPDTSVIDISPGGLGWET